MTWAQSYLLFGHGLFVSALIAAAPVFTLFLLLGILRKPAWVAGLAGLAVTLVLAFAAYRVPLAIGSAAAAEGAAFGLFPISWITFWALVLFRVSVENGQFETIKNSLSRLTQSPPLQGLLIAFLFGAFLEGAAGFGAPIAIASAMLIGLGFTPYRASAICLLANSAPVAFGSIGIPLITLAGTTGLALNRLSASAGLLCAPFALIMPAYLVAALWGFPTLAQMWKPVVLSGGVFALVQWMVSTYMGPQLPNILASLSSVVVLLAFLHYFPQKRLHEERSEEAAKQEQGNPYSAARLLYAWLPYIFLVACVLLFALAPIHRALELASFNLPWPSLHNLVLRMPPVVASPSPYPALFRVNILSTPGTACMMATILSAICGRMSPQKFLRLLFTVARQLALPTLTVTSVLAIAFLMNYCGATATLGLAFSATARLFPFFSALLGWLGVFLTGSDTASNALFGNLQVVTAGRLGMDPVLMASTNSVGGVMGKMLSLQSIAVAAAATGISAADQSNVIRFTLKHSLLLVCLVGIFALLLASHVL